MNPLYFDDLAETIISRRLRKRPNAALRLTLQATYSRGGACHTLTLCWVSAASAAREPDLLQWAGPHGIPMYIAPRLWRYLVWHPLRVRGERLGPFSRLLPLGDIGFDLDLRRWERLHPAMELPTVAA